MTNHFVRGDDVRGRAAWYMQLSDVRIGHEALGFDYPINGDQRPPGGPYRRTTVHNRAAAHALGAFAVPLSTPPTTLDTHPNEGPEMTDRAVLEANLQQAQQQTLTDWQRFRDAQRDLIAAYLRDQGRITAIQQDQITPADQVPDLRLRIEEVADRTAAAAWQYLAGIDNVSIFTGSIGILASEEWRRLFYPFAKLMIDEGYAAANHLTAGNPSPPAEWRYYTANATPAGAPVPQGRPTTYYRSSTDVPRAPEWSTYTKSLDKIAAAQDAIDDFDRDARRNDISRAWEN